MRSGDGGPITQDKFNSRFTAFYKRMDKNGDSYISISEYMDDSSIYGVKRSTAGQEVRELLKVKQ